MDHQLEAVEKRRQKLIKKLMTFDVFKVGQKQLFELTMLELRTELKRIQKITHPHSGMNSIQWR